MAVCENQLPRAAAQLAFAGLCAALLAGCEGSKPTVEAPREPAAAKPVKATFPEGLDPRLHQPFTEAVLADPPDGAARPPDETKAGKNVARLYEAVVGKDGIGGLWEKVVFATRAGKRLNYTATIETDQGKIAIELWPDVAPNHVRNFVALARAGYYNGLAFDRTVREELEGDKGTFIEYIEAGCPLGTADPTYGSIGYWLKPELSDKVKHEAGTIGAWHGEELETAACKFYITLDKAPWMDGNWTVFGKVTEGLDVARAIRARPVRSEEKDRPQEPVVIRSVTVECKEAEAVAAAGQSP